MKKILITGPNGFIASNLIKQFANEYDFVGVLRKGSELREELKPLVSEVYYYDGTSESLHPAVYGLYGAIHLAAYFTNKDTEEERKKLIYDNIIFSSHLFQAFRRIQNPEERLTPIVTAQTFTAYDEHHNENPANYYSTTKLAVEALVEGLNATFLVVPDTFGAGDVRPKIHNLINRGVVDELRSPLEQEMNLMHVADVGAAFISAVVLGNNPREERFTSYDLLFPENIITLAEVCEILEKRLGSSHENELTPLPRVKRLLPGFSPERVVKEHLHSAVVLGERGY